MSKLQQFTSAGWNVRSVWHQCQVGRAWLACMWCWIQPDSVRSSPAGQTATTTVIEYDPTMEKGSGIVTLRSQLHTHTQMFNGLFSSTTWVGQYQKDKSFWILLKQMMMGWQWHELNHMQIICTSLQTDNYASTSSLHRSQLVDQKYEVQGNFINLIWILKTNMYAVQ